MRGRWLHKLYKLVRYIDGDADRGPFPYHARFIAAPSPSILDRRRSRAHPSPASLRPLITSIAVLPSRTLPTMLCRRVCASVRNAVPAAPSNTASSRAFAALAAAQSPARAPALADIKPEGASKFNERQKEFRDGLVSAQKKKEQQESQSYSLSASDTSTGEGPSMLGKTLSSLTSSHAEEARARDEEGGKKKGGALSSLIYGTPEGRELDKDIERSFSQVLARGKYVHSIVFHEVKPDKVDEYTELVGSWYPRMASMPEHGVHLVGSWRTEVGDCDTFGASQQTNAPAITDHEL